MVAEVGLFLPTNTAQLELRTCCCSAESELEAAIEAAKERMYAATDRQLKLQYWRVMCRLMDQRTPERQQFLKRLEQMQSPPSRSTRIEQASVERRRAAAGGVP